MVQSQIGQTRNSQLPTWLEVLITPRSLLERVEDVRRARLFLIIMLVGILIALMVGVIGLLIQKPIPGFFIGAMGFALAYVVGRFVSFTLCKFYVLIVMTNSSLLLLLFKPEWFNMPQAFLGMIITTLLALLLVRIQTALAVVIVNVMVLLFLPFIDRQATELVLYLTMLGAVSIISILMMVMGYLSESDIERAYAQAEALRDTGDHFRRLLDSSPDLMAVHANGKFLYINAAGMRLLGAARLDDIIGQDVRHFMAEGQRSLVAAQPPHMNADHALTVSYHQTLQRMDRRLIDMDVTVSPIQFESELATLLVARDRRTQDSPSQNEFPMDRLMDRLPVPIFVTSDATLVYANHYIEALTGYTPAELKRQSLSNIISDVETRTHDDSLAGRIQESEVRVKHKSGQVRTLILRTQTQEYRGQRLAVNIGYDPRQHTRWNDQEAWMLETAFANYPEGLLYLDTDLRNGPTIISANRVFCHVSGYTAEELRGRTLHFFLGTQGEASAAELVRQSLAQGETFEGSVVYQRKDTTSAAVSWSVRPIRDDRGQMLFALLRQRPLTETETAAKSPLLPPESEGMMLELISGYVFILDMTPDEQIRLVKTNAAVHTLRRWTEQDYPSVQTWSDVVAPLDIESVTALRYEHLRDTLMETIEMSLRTYDPAKTRPVRLTLRVLPLDEATGTLRVYGVAQDISQHTPAEEALKVHLIQQSVVMELGLLAIAAEDFKSLAEQVVLMCEQVMPEAICVAALYQPDEKQLVVVGRGTSKIVPPIIPFDMQLVTGYTAETALPILVADYATDERFHAPPWLPAGHIRSALSVAIPGQQHVYGVLTLFHALPQRFSEDDIYFVQSIANVLAAFAERERMLNNEREHREFLRIMVDVRTVVNSSMELSEVVRTAHDAIVKVVTIPHNSIIALLNSDNRLHILSQRGYDDIPSQVFEKDYGPEEMPIAHAMIKSHQPIIIDDMSTSSSWYMAYSPQVLSFVAAPILVEDQCIGIINLTSSKKAAFSSLDMERLMVFSGKIGTAIRNARYAQELETKIEERTLALSRQRGQLQAILDTSAEGICYTENGQIVFANDALSRMTGYSLEEMRQHTARVFYPDDMTEHEITLADSVSPTLNTGQVWRNAMRVRRKDGTTFYAGLTISRVASEDDPIVRSVIIIRDIEMERRLEENKARFISNAAHELRSPISNLNARVYLLRRTPQQTEEHLRVLDRVIERINRLVNDLLDMSYFEYGHVALRKQTLVLQEGLLKALEFVQAEADQKGVILQCDLPIDPIALLADPYRLEQVFINVLIFGLLYTEAAHTMTISLDLDAAADQVIVNIEDHGRGIPPEHIAHLFEPFYRLDIRQPGSGLGLTLAREIVMLHNGTLDVTSHSERGTHFIIRLPLDGMGREA